LQERRVPCPSLCPICEQHDQDDWHVMFGCAASIQARHAAGLAGSSWWFTTRSAAAAPYVA
ncbi:hypothetical protein A2U01_0047423, partial [Trifolium medium]|nr:hypothetical protein [Trifolium medium]